MSCGCLEMDTYVSLVESICGPMDLGPPLPQPSETAIDVIFQEDGSTLSFSADPVIEAELQRRLFSDCSLSHVCICAL